MPMKIRAAARRLAADGQLDQQDVKQLIDCAKDGVSVTPSEQRTLKKLLDDPAYSDKFTPEARADLQDFLGITPTPPTPSPDDVVTADLGVNPAGQNVLLKDGFFVSDAEAEIPSAPLDVGKSFYMAASLIAESSPEKNVFAGLGTAQKQQILESMQMALRQAPADVDVPAGYDNALQARQQRSAVATTLLELMRSTKPEDSQELLLQDTMLKTYSSMAQKETSSALRDSMVFQLHHNKDCLATAQQREVSNELMRAFAPNSPPYEDWFKDGNDTLNVVCHTGGEFFSSEVSRWKREGYEESADSSAARTILEKTFERNGVETKVRLTMMRGAGGTFDDMDDASTHIVGYSGHAGWGRNIPRELRRAPEQDGQKLVIVNQCCGRGIINKFRDKYSDSQLITTKNSSYESEDFNTFAKTIEGVAGRRSWASISNGIRNDPWRNRRDNYYFPNDALLRMRSRDRDHDGVTDVVDRLVNFNTFDPAEDTANEFRAKDPGCSFEKLDGTMVHEATQIINTTTKFSDFMEYHANGDSFVSKGYFAPQGPDDPMVSIKQNGDDFELEVNAEYAHASEEAIKAEAFYTVAHTPPFQVEDDSKLDTCLKGLILVGHSLDVDSGFRDEDIFKALLEHHELPAIDIWDVKACVDVNHVYAGSAASIRKLKEKLGPELLAKIEAAVDPDAAPV